MTTKRLVELDVFRGWAILLMVIFHITYDLNYFHFIKINLHTHIFWSNFRYLIVTIFLLSVGISLSMTHYPKIQWQKMLKRTVILGTLSLIITVATYFVFPKSWVYFGILHFILTASWIGLLFLPYPRLSLLVALLILIGSAMGWLHMHGVFSLLQDSLHLPPKFTEDVLLPFPWLAAVLIGISLTRYNLHTKLLQNKFLAAHTKVNTLLAFFGRHALLIYLIHLPLLFGLFMLCSR
jgi:uncharacterized membrane protein